MAPFNITLADNIEFTVTPVHLNGTAISYQISIAGKNHGLLTPYTDDHTGVAWRTDDPMDSSLVNMIGRLIDHHGR
ncbi:hypothetical protein [Pedobacter sp. L105]|uniref:hypothetical protein n=1 Tax=Pedobacter sp. L105 TaxID=1641871 RepID=UPI00131B0300|nr:hypothetical protein [Pedobacter sp. L105]